MRNKALALERAAQRRFGPALPAEIRALLARDFLRGSLMSLTAEEMGPSLLAAQTALAYAPEIVHGGSMVREAVRTHLRREEVVDPFGLVASVFELLLPKTRHLSREKARLLSGLHMREVFEGSAQSRGQQVDAHWWAGLLGDPRWALRRGVWAIGVRRLIDRMKLSLLGSRQRG
jgi:hypothetical protein